MRIANSRWLGLTGPFALVLGWQLVHYLDIVSPTLLPGPVETFDRLSQILWTGNVTDDLIVTFSRMGTGYILAVFVGIFGGLIIGSFGTIYRMSEPTIDFFRSLPVTTLYPIFVLMFGIGDSSKIAMVFAASVFVILLNTAYGVIQANPTRSQMAYLFGASRTQIFRWVTFRESLPQTLIGLRVALSYSLIVEVVAEMFMGTQKGIGQRIFEAYTTYSIDELYALILIMGFLGYLLNVVFVGVEKRLVHWSGK